VTSPVKSKRVRSLKSRIINKSTINVKKVCKESTSLSIGAAFLRELVEFMEKDMIPTMVVMSAKRSQRDGRKTLMEQDFVAMKDYVWYYMSQVSKY
jgi:hypothetical protein